MNLFEPISVGSLTLANHFIRSATYEGKAGPEGQPTDAIRNSYLELAYGGIGTIITSYVFIAPYEQPAKNQLGLHRNELIPSYQTLVDAIHNAGSTVVAQLVHGSCQSQAHPESAHILGPSALVHPTSGLCATAMEAGDFQTIANLFAQAALRAKKAGFDGIQIHGAHGFLLSHFTSPLFNHRRDEYGGSAENRIRFTTEVLAAIRRTVGHDYPVWIKMNTSDEVDGGLTIDDFLIMAEIIARAGIDAIELSGARWKYHPEDERAYYKEAALRLAKRVEVPLILTGGLRNRQDLTEIFSASDGKINLFGFSRPFLADPNFVQTLRGPE